MRIALISYEYPPETGFGGIGTYAHYHARALSRLGHEVHVFAGTQSSERRTYRDGHVTVTRMRKVGLVERLMPRLDRVGLPWFKNRLQNAANSFSSLLRELRNGAFDVIEMPECGAEGALINTCLDLPTVVRLHSPAELIMSTYPSQAADRMLTSMVERLGISGARALSSCSSWLAQEVRRRGLTTRAITVIPNGIDLSVFDQDEGIDILARFRIPKDRLKIFFANRLEHRKGIHVVEAMLLPVLQRNPEAVFVLAGHDPDQVVERRLRPLLASHGLADRLFQLGRLPLREVRACLKQCDVFLLPSIWENAPYSLLEAMSAGKAIVASDCGGVPEMLRHDIDGLLAHTEDASAFARAIQRLENPGLRQRLGQSARARVEAHYTDELVARRSLEFYRWALSAPLGEPHAALVRPGLELGAENWFQGWWIRGQDAGETPVVGADLAQLGLDELAFVHAVSARVYWAQRGRGEGNVVDYLDELATLHRQRALEAQEGKDVPVVTGRLGLPALSHPMFADDGAAEAFLAEMWRLWDHDVLTQWLCLETGISEVVERAQRSVALRRLAIEAFRRRPDERTASVLRRIYRDVGHAARVVQQDRDFIATHAKGPELARLVAEFGLHAPLRRPAVFAAPRRRKARDAGAEVTVLIPSYRHEAFVGAAIASVLAQTHGRLRVLVVDDQSPDGTVAAARAVADPRVEVRVNAANLGLGGSLLAALDAIETPYVALLNSDDVFHPERLEKCLAVLAADPAAALVATGIATMDDKERRLTSDNACVPELGTAIAGWVRWYERVTAPLSGAAFAELPPLLRHNHLATSSNVVCRTGFLREHAARIAPLKYCLDWSLFLQACIAGSLRFLPEPLIGYRLHAGNTVWFDAGSRPGYVHEVNAVVADALRALVVRRCAEGIAPPALAEELAVLLQDAVAAHGETDGLSLFLADLTAGHAAVPAAFDTAGLVRMAEAALLRRRPSVDAELARRARLDRHAVEALRRRNGALEPLVRRLRDEGLRAESVRADVAAFRQRLEDEQQAVTSAEQAAAAAGARAAGLEADLLHVRGELAALRGECERRAAEHAREVERLQIEGAEVRAALTAQAADFAAERAAERSALQARIGEFQARLAADGAALLRRVAEVRSLEAELAAAHERARADRGSITELERRLAEADRSAALVRAELETASTARDRAQAELAQAHAALHQANERAARRQLEQRAAVARIEAGLEFRFGRFVLRKLHVGAVLKTALRGFTLLRIGSARLLGGLRKQIPGRKPVRVVFACDDAFPAADCMRIAGEAATVTAAGFDVRIVGWTAGSPHWLDDGLYGLLDRRVVLSHDAALLAGDRRYFAKRNPRTVAALEGLPVDRAELLSAFAFARSARALNAGYLQAVGFGAAALHVFAAGQLLRVAYGLRLEAGDLETLDRPRSRLLAAGANALFVDSEAAARHARRALGSASPDVLVVPPLVVPPRRVPAPTAQGRFVAIGPFQDAQGLLLVAEAAKQAVAAGADPRFVVLGAESAPVGNLVALDALRQRLRELGIQDRFEFRPDAGPEQVWSAVAGCTALIDATTGLERPAPQAGIPWGVAQAASCPVLSLRLSGNESGRGLPVRGGEISAPALVEALTMSFVGKEMLAPLVPISRRESGRSLAVPLGIAELPARIRALLNART